MKLYLDDERPTPDGWVRSYTVKETLDWLKTGRVTHLSLDNDLGSNDPSTEGFNVLDKLEEWVHDVDGFPIPIITIHSANAGRTPSMRKIAAKLELIRQSRLSED